MNSFREKLALLRTLMRENSIDAYIIPSTDPHLGEYIPDHWRIIPWLTGFTGSAGTVVVTDTFAGLWTDSRYFVQAEKQLNDSGFAFMKPSLSDKNNFTDWLAGNIKNGAKIATDGKTISISKVRNIEHALSGRNISFVPDIDIISSVWNDRPSLPATPAFDLPVAFCGKDREIKISEVRELMSKQKTDYHLLTSIDDTMWLLNIRGGDVKYSPLLTSFAIISEEQILLFADEEKIPFRLAREFDRIGVVMLPYEEIAGILSSLSDESTILINPETTSASLFNAIPKGMKIIEGLTIPGQLKAVKNKVEIENMAKAMVKDGIVLSKFFFWLENYSGSEALTELSLVEKIDGLRSEQPDFLGVSFSTIVAFNANGALPHYSVTKDSDSLIGSEGILLIDSGGQYFNGTTDITRTISIGRPSARQIKDFTLVLKGTINLAMAKMPAGTKGIQLDILARKALWEEGLNYGHGTGHGVGFCLNVHEGPQSISPGESTASKTAILPGMVMSDEPGIYREGEYGIRIENLILCYEDEETEFGQFLKFETLSLCYIDKSLIDVSLLGQKEIKWLNSYHSEVYEKLSPFLTTEESLWLKEKTDPV